MPKTRGICTMEGCGKPHKAHGYCGVHYFRLMRTGDPLCVRKPPGLPANTTGCSVAGCAEPHSVHGYCRAHARRLRIYGDPTYVPATRKPRAMQPLAERFWEKVTSGAPDACWFWKGQLNKDGYGKFTIDGKSISAHRVAWELTNGPMQKDQDACHSCEGRYPAGDTTYRRCVTPAHVFPGTHAENSKDMRQKGRHARLKGEASPQAKLTESDVIAIRARAATGTPNKELAAAYGVTGSMIGQIVRGTAWSHV